MFRTTVMAGFALALLAGPVLASSGDRIDSHFYVAKNTTGDGCHVTSSPVGALIGVYSSHLAAERAMAIKSACR